MEGFEGGVGLGRCGRLQALEGGFGERAAAEVVVVGWVLGGSLAGGMAVLAGRENRSLRSPEEGLFEREVLSTNKLGGPACEQQGSKFMQASQVV